MRLCLLTARLRGWYAAWDAGSSDRHPGFLSSVLFSRANCVQTWEGFRMPCGRGFTCIPNTFLYLVWHHQRLTHTTKHSTKLPLPRAASHCLYPASLLFFPTYPLGSVVRIIIIYDALLSSSLLPWIALAHQHLTFTSFLLLRHFKALAAIHYHNVVRSLLSDVC